MLLYIHVPFCRSRCRYCAFHSTALGRGVEPEHSERFQAYTETLFRELEFWGRRLRGRSVSSVFFGGGTPSLLPPRVVGRLLERMADVFACAPGMEITLEANPESLRSVAQIRAFRQAGVNRLSMGCQSLDDALLRCLGRAHRAADCRRAMDLARDAGMAAVNLDFIWGLPGQSVAHWLHTLDAAVAMAPEHLSAYGLTLEEGTPLERDCAAGRLALPSEDAQAAMFLEGAAFLESAGFRQYEISNFARPGCACRHNLGYWEGVEYLGLGPAATSTIGGRRWTNAAGQDAWAAAVAGGRPDAVAEAITPRLRVLEGVMLRLRTAEGLSAAMYNALVGRDVLSDHGDFIRELQKRDLARFQDGRLCLTRRGMLVSNGILADFFERLDALL